MEREFNKYLADVFMKVFIGLVITTLTAFAVYTSKLYETKEIIYGALFLELICVIVFSFTFHKLPKPIVYLLYFMYCALTGVAFSIYPVLYEGGSIVTAILITSALFLGLAIYRYFTTNDLTNIRPYLFYGLIGIIISSIVNIFLGNPFMDMVISWISIIIFLGYTAYDTQKLYDYYRMEHSDGNTNFAIYGAFQLYLDYINLFIDILRIVGTSKDDD